MHSILNLIGFSILLIGPEIPPNFSKKGYEHSSKDHIYNICNINFLYNIPLVLNLFFDFVRVNATVLVNLVSIVAPESRLGYLVSAFTMSFIKSNTT